MNRATPIAADRALPKPAALERAWDRFALLGRDATELVPLIRESWIRSRDLHRIDPAIERSPMVLAERDLVERRERLGALRLGLPFLEQLSDGLRGTHHGLGLLDADGYVVATVGDPGVLEDLAAINFRPGGNWNEQTVGTNGPGTALAARKPVQIIGPEHYVHAWQRWACSAAPICDPITGETLAVIDVTGYRESAQPHTLLAVYSTAALIQQRLLLELTLEEKLLCEAFAARASRYPADAIFAVDQRGRAVHFNATAQRIVAARTGLAAQSLIDEFRPALSKTIERGGARTEAKTEDRELIVSSQTLGRELRATVFAVLHQGRTIGAILAIPPGALAHSAATDRIATVLRPAARPGGARYVFEDIVAGSPRMTDAVALAHTVAENDLPVLVTGESGTGKEMIAQSIHNASARAGGPFVAVNCGSIPEELIDSEFFGYEEGAFTGARRGGSIGKFEHANRGTIFLDEVSELSPRSQAALLRVLQEMEIVRVGGAVPRRIDARVIAATNRDLRAQVAAGRFRSDLFYRLNVMEIRLPPLRERIEDLPVLAARFLDELPGRSRPSLGEAALDALCAYRWPGNVRELHNVIHRAAIMARGPAVEPDDLPEELLDAPLAQSVDSARNSTQHVADPGRERLLAVLGECRGNVAEAARRMALSRMTLYRKLRKWSVSRLEVLKAAHARDHE
jgi:transcriptional regulator of acetoin/glycerol metabolism